MSSNVQNVSLMSPSISVRDVIMELLIAWWREVPAAQQPGKRQIPAFKYIGSSSIREAIFQDNPGPNNFLL